MTTLLKTLASDVLSLFYPVTCQGCGGHLVKGETILCLNCHINLPRTLFYTEKDNPVAKLFRGRMMLEQATSFLYFRKTGMAQRLIHQLKYKGRQDVGEYLGTLFGRDLRAQGCFTDVDVIVPLPLHKRKLMQRGYNQSVCIAKGLSSELGIAVDTGLAKRLRATATQTRKKRFERWQNAEQLFAIEPGKAESLKGRHVLIVDDIITTGATIEACALVFIESGASRVSVLSLGFAC